MKAAGRRETLNNKIREDLVQHCVCEASCQTARWRLHSSPFASNGRLAAGLAFPAARRRGQPAPEETTPLFYHQK